MAGHCARAGLGGYITTPLAIGELGISLTRCTIIATCLYTSDTCLATTLASLFP